MSHQYSNNIRFMDLGRLQAALIQFGFDGWLFYDHHHRDPIAYRVLELPETGLVSRRWFYLIPARGTPKKLVHRVEWEHLDSFPGDKYIYSAQKELFDEMKNILSECRRVAMQY